MAGLVARGVDPHVPLSGTSDDAAEGVPAMGRVRSGRLWRTVNLRNQYGRFYALIGGRPCARNAIRRRCS